VSERFANVVYVVKSYPRSGGYIVSVSLISIALAIVGH
jgi:hypothetical protein